MIWPYSALVQKLHQGRNHNYYKLLLLKKLTVFWNAILVFQGVKISRTNITWHNFMFQEKCCKWKLLWICFLTLLRTHWNIFLLVFMLLVQANQSSSQAATQPYSHASMHPCIQAAMKSYNHLVIQASRHQASEQKSKQANSIKKPEKEGGGPKVLLGAFVV